MNDLQLLKDKGFCPSKILDIGAGTGSFVELCKGVWPTCFVHSIEANEKCKDKLINIADKVDICLLGLENKESAIYHFDKNDEYGQGNSIYKEIHYSDYIEIKLPMFSLSSITNDIYDLIKIDTQGSELDIINGGINIIRNSKCVILEMSILPYNHGAPLYKEVVYKMLNLDFYPRYEVEQHRLPLNNKLIQVDIAFFNLSLV